jgi:hypothetical protein
MIGPARRASAVVVCTVMFTIGAPGVDPGGPAQARADQVAQASSLDSAGADETAAPSAVGVPGGTEPVGTGAPPPPIREYLSRFSQAERDNASISLQLGRGATAEAQAAAQNVVKSWNEGAQDQALTAMASLEDAGIAVAVGIQWHNPVPVGTGVGLGADKRLGGTRIGASQVVLGRYLSMRTFAAIRWSAFGAESGWSLNVSEDKGASWSELYYWYGYAHDVRDIDLLPDYPVVAYVWDGDPVKVYAQDFDAVNGHAYSETWVYLDDSTSEKMDVAIDGYDWTDEYGTDHNDMVVAAIQADGQLVYEILSANYSLSHTVHASGRYDANEGLDLTTVWSESDSKVYIFASYIGDGNVRVWDSTCSIFDHEVSPFTDRVTTLGAFTGTHPHTTIMSANSWFEPKLICLYESAFNSGQGVRYQVSEDSGDTWSSQMLVTPGPEQGQDYHMPFMPAHSACAVFAQAGTAKAWFSAFSWEGMRWSPPAAFSSHSCDYNAPLAVESVPEAPSGESYSFGVAYINRSLTTNGSPEYVPYFDRAPGPGGYCHARGTYEEGPPIGYVGVGSIDDLGGSVSYRDQWYLSTQMARGRSYELEVRAAYPASSTWRCVVWIDWNQDLDFDDAGERIPAPIPPDPGQWNITITPPMDAALGKTRMRIRVVNYPVLMEPCEGMDSGAVIDYSVEVIDYCEASGGCGQYVSRVQIGDIDNTSACDTGYHDYRSVVTDLHIGQAYPLTITIGDGNSGNFGALWIDWNQNLSFFDAGEQIALSPSSGPGPYTATIIPPYGAKPGLTCMRMRVYGGVNSPWNWPCSDWQVGEVEDYALNIVGSTHCGAQGNCSGHIARVQLGDIDNSSDCTIGYTDYTELKTVMEFGRAYDLTVTAGGSTAGDTCRAWIDWNQDGVFDTDDPNETVTLAGSPGVGPYTATVAVPFGALPGETRMRVRLDHTASLGPCGNADHGEVEDYTIVVPQDPHCIGYGQCGNYIYISRVQVADIDNVSDCSLGYANYTDVTTPVLAATAHPLTVTAGNATPYDRCSVWVDWNHDGDFSDNGEIIPVSGTPGQGPYTATIFPTPDAVAGETRMRIRVDYAPLSATGPCDQLEWGEVEDYTLVVVDASPVIQPVRGCGAGSPAGLAGAVVFGGAWIVRRRSGRR